MAEKKPTAGPWEYGKAHNYVGFYIAPKGTLPTLAAVERCGAGQMTIQCFNFPGDTEANAAMIAAAPTMYSYIQKKAEEGDAEARGIVEGIE